MNALGTKLLVVCLSGVLALPVGFCCRRPAEGSPRHTPSQDCCRSTGDEPALPVKAASSCCCQARAKTSVETKLAKRLPNLSWPAVVLSAKPHFATAWELRSHAFLGRVEHSFASFLCVWRC